MADLGIRALAPIVVTPGTTYATGIGPVPAGKEWEIRLCRAVNISGAQQTVSASTGTGGVGEIAFNEVLPVPSATAVGAKNILGPDILALAPGGAVQFRASNASVVRIVAFVWERDL